LVRGGYCLISKLRIARLVQPGCPACRKTFCTVSQFIDHNSEDVLPPQMDQLSTKSHPCQITQFTRPGWWATLYLIASE